MLITYTDLVHLPVTDVDSGNIHGTVTDLVADATQHRVLAFVVRTRRWFGQTKLLSSNDYLSITPAGITIQSAAVLVPRAEIVRIAELTPDQTRVMGRPVITETGQRIGTVTDSVIETETASIVRYHVSSLFGPHRIIPTSAIILVTKQTFVIRTDAADVVVSPETIGITEAV